MTAKDIEPGKDGGSKADEVGGVQNFVRVLHLGGAECAMCGHVNRQGAS